MMDKGLYQYDPETKEFKLRRIRRPWMEADSPPEAMPREPDALSPEAGTTAPEPIAAELDEQTPDAAEAAPARRVKRRKRAPSPYLPQESDAPEANWVRRIIWVLIFLMLVAWVLMISPYLNRIRIQEAPIFQMDKSDFLPNL